MLTSETIVSFSEAAARLPRINGKKIHASSLWRWARKGIHGVRLETRRLGGRFVTSLEALDRFAKRLAEIDPPERPPRSRSRRKARSRAKRCREVEQAYQDVEKHGIRRSETTAEPRRT